MYVHVHRKLKSTNSSAHKNAEIMKNSRQQNELISLYIVY